ncbi:MAG TPA: PilC/PilY family type IV pilus protein [Gammaproteobacteria bacterium]
MYYGDNSGVFHAIKGGTDNSVGGTEMWGFIPSEFFSQLNALRLDIGPISSSVSKPYFFDGPVTTYTLDANNDGELTTGSGDKAYIYLTAHRGGRVMYALDVTDPGSSTTSANPKFLWKATNSTAGFAELGQSWSQVTVATISANTNPVAIFAAGYDNVAEDKDPAGTDTMGRGIYVVDAYTGALLWEAGPSASGAANNLVVSGMTHSIPSSVAVYDSNQDGFADRLYFGDTGGNIWRADIGDSNPANWKVTELASLGGTGSSARKFLFQPDVVFNNDSSGTYDAVLIGSGDREHPFNTTVQNGFFMIKDTHAMSEPAGFTTLQLSNLFNATDDSIQVGTAAQQQAAAVSLASSSGWYILFGANTGEKDVGGDVAVEGSVVFNTYTPTTSSACTPTLGTATQYIVSYKDASATINLTGQTNMVIADRSQNMAGGGFVPTPVHISVSSSTGQLLEAVVSGPNVFTFQGATNVRVRTYWKKGGGQ